MSLSPADAVSHLRERLSHRSPDDLSAEASAMALVKDLAQTLKGEGAKRVILFGSLADGRFTRGSDIDLAVNGLTEGALARLEYDFTILARRPVELANLGCMPESLRQSIERFGLELV